MAPAINCNRYYKFLLEILKKKFDFNNININYDRWVPKIVSLRTGLRLHPPFVIE